MRQEHPQRQQSSSAFWRLARAAIIALCAIITLFALGVGGAVTAQRYTSAGQSAVAAPITYVSQQPPNALNPSPIAVGACDSCKSIKTSISYQPGAFPPPPGPAGICSGPRVPMPGDSATPPSTASIPSTGQFVLVSIPMQWLWAYDNGKLYMQSPVTTGMPYLSTWTGAYSVTFKESNVWFYSPWPYGSPYYYTPEFVPYAMRFFRTSFYLHAAPWRHQFGPGTNVPHCDADGTWETGSHGCVNLPTGAASQLYAWIRYSTTVRIV